MLKTKKLSSKRRKSTNVVQKVQMHGSDAGEIIQVKLNDYQMAADCVWCYVVGMSAVQQPKAELGLNIEGESFGHQTCVVGRF